MTPAIPQDGSEPLPGAGLGDGEVHLWHAAPGPAAGDGPLERLLSPDERERYRATRFEGRRREYLLTRALLRSALSAYAPTPPWAWRFCLNPHGRPELATPSPLRFNLSHCDGMVACAVAQGREIGLDVEPAGRAATVLELAARVFSPREREALSTAASHRARCDLALALWTLKEAYLKARGVGLALPLRSLTFTLGAEGIGLEAPPEVDPAPERWAFASLEVGAHRAAVAAGGPGRPARLRLRRTSPLELAGPGVAG